MTILASYVATNQFTVATDRQAEFHVGRRVQADCGADGIKYGTIGAVSYVDPNTVVTLTAGSDPLTVNLARVKYGLVGHGPTQSVPEHGHGTSEGEGGAVNHSALNDDEPAKHRQINDIGSGITDLWSANKIGTELAGKAAAGDLTTHTGTIDIHRKITISTLDPSGGVDGDIWLKHEV